MEGVYGEYIVISASEIADIEIDDFGINGRHSEYDYKELLEKYQYIFNTFDSDKSYADMDEFYSLFLDSGGAITVCKGKNGLYEYASNGRHRLYVAKKYNLSVLVCLITLE